MVRKLAEGAHLNYEWIDLLDPSEEDLQQVAQQYGLHEASVTDAMQADHIPKYERVKDYTFIILRIYSPDEHNDEADTVKELTNKITIFISQTYIITIHRKEWPVLERISSQLVKKGECKKSAHVLNEIVKAGLLTFDVPGTKLTKHIEHFEEHIFLKDRRSAILKGLYFMKRRVDVLRRVLLLSSDIVENIDPPGSGNAYTRDVRDLYIKQQSLFESLFENTNHLLNIYFNISAHKTNEIIRVLTIFSVFFLPLTFIAGIYGMNFNFMPELKWKQGYPGAMLLMVAVTLSIYAWFKRKKWL
ncbi:magnesium transporter CorA family protein [Filimonas effusa]|uniref:Magnesium transport protein CorA n=1 Tax=Filimonas effusa TaxID=2508721 RepID=A0A4Q1D5G7_9BACT|nr:CorA family divalent cation transporter [Filimonas effusa]RXK83735.1 magnesium transporter CorA [Filimonas effusa]